MGVTTPCAGEIAKIDAQVKETYPIGAVLGYIEASEKDAARFPEQAPPTGAARNDARKFPDGAKKHAKGRKNEKQLAPERKFRLTDCPFPLPRKGQGFCRRAFARAWRSCN